MSRTVLVSGGTRGIGRAIGLAFARQGCRVVLTHRWGSVEPEELAEAFAEAGASAPEVVEADVADGGDLQALLEHIGPDGVDVFIPNVCVAGRGDGTLSPRTLRRSLQYSAWPLLRHLEAMKQHFGRLPSHVVATSSDGPDRFYPGYDYVAASKAVLEALCRDLADQNPAMRINALRARQVDTESYREMFGGEARAFIGRFSDFDLVAEEVADAAVCLAGGDLDGLSGEVLTVDRGAGPMDNLVVVAPRLFGEDAAWEGFADAPAAAPPGVLWVDAGVPPQHGADLGSEVAVVPLQEVSSVAGGDVPASVVVGCDWRDIGSEEGIDRGTVLLELLERAADAGRTPRYGIRLDLGSSSGTAGAALGDVLSRYWGSWRVATSCRTNSVRIDDEARAPEAMLAVRALLSGALDGARGQSLRVTRPSLDIPRTAQAGA